MSQRHQLALKTFSSEEVKLLVTSRARESGNFVNNKSLEVNAGFSVIRAFSLPGGRHPQAIDHTRIQQLSTTRRMTPSFDAGSCDRNRDDTSMVLRPVVREIWCGKCITGVLAMDFLLPWGNNQAECLFYHLCSLE